MPDRRSLRRALPRPVRERLYDWNPTRIRRWRRFPGLQRLDSAESAVLTFDDGPDPESTARLLEILSAADARATFFVLGQQVLDHPELTREAHSRGHEIAVHGMTHRRHDGLSASEALEELAAGAAAIESTIGARPRWYRPPFGRASDALLGACAQLGLSLAYWSAWGHDWEAVPARRIAKLVSADLGPGAVVLLHDTARYNQRPDPGPTLEAVPMIAAAARGAGLSLITLGDAAGGAG
jgi:peptidoglycan/xylan/chitin deacetylase (PgdA/CDA1 family)